MNKGSWPMSIWARPGIEDVFKAHWDKGESSSKIASALSKAYGQNISRNAVIGKALRMGWKRSDDNLVVTRYFGGRSNAQPGKSRKLTVAKPAKVLAPKVTPMPGWQSAGLQRSLEGAVNRASGKTVLPPFQAPQPVNVDGQIGISMADLDAGMCKWPLSLAHDIADRFCGAKCQRKSGGFKSYCEGHSSASAARIQPKPKADVDSAFLFKRAVFIANERRRSHGE